MTRIVVSAIGSRGDVAPILDVVVSIRRRQPELAVAATFITNAGHKDTSWMKAYISRYGGKDRISFDFVELPILCGSLDERDEASFYAKADGITESMQAAFENGPNVNLILANAFSMQAYLFAVKYTIPIVFVHGHELRSTSTPAQLMHRWKLCSPSLYDHIFRNEETTESVRSKWLQFLWPITSPYYDELRDELKLPQMYSPDFVVPDIPVEVLLTVSAKVHDHSPSCYNYCGHVRVREQGIYADFDSHHQLDLFSQRVTSSGVQDMLCVDFGSMTDLIEDVYTADVFASVLKQSQETTAFVIVCHGNTKFAEKLRSISSAPSDGPRVLVIDGDLDHREHLKRFAALVHHGGSGTVGTCLDAHLPQGKRSANLFHFICVV